MPEPHAYGEDTTRAVDSAVHALVEAGFIRAVKILERNRTLLDRAAEQLLKSETLDQIEIEEIKKQIVAEGPGQVMRATTGLLPGSS